EPGGEEEPRPDDEHGERRAADREEAEDGDERAQRPAVAAHRRGARFAPWRRPYANRGHQSPWPPCSSGISSKTGLKPSPGPNDALATRSTRPPRPLRKVVTP